MCDINKHHFLCSLKYCLYFITPSLVVKYINNKKILKSNFHKLLSMYRTLKILGYSSIYK